MNMRIGGLASGMDTDSLVKDLMKAERLPLNKLKQKKQILEWQRDDFRSLNTLLLDFRTELTNMKLTTKYRARTTSSTNSEFVTATATSSASQASYSINSVSQLASAATKVNNTATGNISGSDKIDSSKGLFQQKEAFSYTTDSTNTYWKSGVVESKTIKAPSDTKVISLGLTESSLADKESWSVKVNGKSYNVLTTGTPGDNDVVIGENGQLTFKNNIAKDSTIKVDYVSNTKNEQKTLDAATSTWQLSKGSINTITSFTIDKNDGNGAVIHTFGETVDGKSNIVNPDGEVVGTLTRESGLVNFNPQLGTGAKLDITYDTNYTTFSLDTHTSTGPKYESFLIQGNESLNSVISKVNGSTAGVTMFYDTASDRVALTRNETGDFNKIDSANANPGYEINITGDFLNKALKFENATETGGNNAVFTINGLETNRTSNTFEMNGVNFTLKNKFNETGSATTIPPIQVTINNDSEKVYENIKGFVDKYNELIGKINGKLSEERYRDYLPLSDEDREGLSDKQQEMWEEKAKSGLLRRDPTLTSLLSKMRMDFYSPVSSSNTSSSFNQLAAIGIKTSANYLEGGKLEINEAQLKKAIQEDPLSVENLFRATGTNDSENGIAQRLYTTVLGVMDQLKEKAGNTFSTNQQFSLGRNLSNVDSQINRFESRLIQVEDRYWRQFTAMEKAIQRSNEQSMFLMNQFG